MEPEQFQFLESAVAVFRSGVLRCGNQDAGDGDQGPGGRHPLQAGLPCVRCLPDGHSGSGLGAAERVFLRRLLALRDSGGGIRFPEPGGASAPAGSPRREGRMRGLFRLLPVRHHLRGDHHPRGLQPAGPLGIDLSRTLRPLPFRHPESGRPERAGVRPPGGFQEVLRFLRPQGHAPGGRRFGSGPGQPSGRLGRGHRL